MKTHPMSDYFMWERWGRENEIKVIHSEYIFNVLNACDLYVTKTGSITVAEAWLLGKPVIKVGKDYDSASSVEQSNLDVLNASDVKGLIDLVGNYGEFQPKLYGDYLKKWGVYPLNAAATIAERVRAMLQGESQLSYVPTLVALNDALRGVPSEPRVDGYGNWDKAISQFDVEEWAMKIDANPPVTYRAPLDSTWQ
jgi:hypothetical protein